MEYVKIQNKIKLLFEKLAEPNYVMNNYYADGLINKLSNCSDPEISFLEKIPLVSDLIIDTLEGIDNVHNSVQVFLIRTLAIASQRELHFAKIFARTGNKILAGFKEINSPNMNASLRVAYMEVALSVVKHNSGISWLLETGVWKEILSLCNEKRTVFVVRQTYKFASEFLWKLNDLADVENIKLILGFILKPVMEVDYLRVESMTSEEEENICKTIEPMVQILLSVVSMHENILKSTPLINIIIKECNLTSHMYIVLDIMRKEETSLLIAKLIFHLVFTKIFLTKPITAGQMYNMDDFLELSVSFINTMQCFFQRRSAILVLDYCTSCNLIWTAIWKDKTSLWVCDKRKIELQNQMLFIIMVPLLVFVSYGKTTSQMPNECINEYIIKLLNMLCEHTAKPAYAMRDLTEELDTTSIILHSIKKLSCLKNHLNDEQANLIFQGLFYVLKEFDPTDNYGELKPEVLFEDSHEKVLVMTYVVDTVQWLVKYHNIIWHESLEILCLYSIVNNILKRPNLTCKFVVAALNVIALTVKKFLTPNLSLLLETTPGSSMHELGKLINMRMNDMHWEIRDSALELLFVCTEISFIKFPPFQKQIMENDLINVAATIALNDYEAYVQVSALKCLGAASKMNKMWEQLRTQYPDIQDQLISILRNNQEGIVRKEACNVLCEMYQHLKLIPAQKQTIYEHMVSSALSDFHWEVQLSALKFWRIVYQNLLMDQGMLDGVFPPVTFSRETRKIVTLNEVEIQRRLSKILDELASIGCLTVLMKLLYDDSEVEIMDCTLSLSLELIDILNRYKVPDCLKPNPNDIMSVSDLMAHIKEDKDDDIAEESGPTPTEERAEKVIEGILNADDVNLLANIYERHMNLQQQDNALHLPIKPKIKLLQVASPYLFVNYLLSNDFKTVVENKRKWNDGIRSVSSLLDDVLGIYEMNEEVNSLDCY